MNDRRLLFAVLPIGALIGAATAAVVLTLSTYSSAWTPMPVDTSGMTPTWSGGMTRLQVQRDAYASITEIARGDVVVRTRHDRVHVRVVTHMTLCVRFAWEVCVRRMAACAWLRFLVVTEREVVRPWAPPSAPHPVAALACSPPVAGIWGQLSDFSLSWRPGPTHALEPVTP